MRSLTASLHELTRKRDFYAGALMVLLGCGVAVKGVTYPTGTLTHIGPGFLPTALGVTLAVLGIAIALTATTSNEKGREEGDDIVPEEPQWRGWFCILAGPVLFILCGHYFGMIPGTFACVFVSALGDRTATWKSSFILAIVVTAFGVGLFSYFLQVPMPVLAWKTSL
jgi:putative Ca2+/H+ antiporter (TMEM165/GDT1 family)